MEKSIKCATEIAKWLAKHELTDDVCIYADHKRFKVSEKGKLEIDLEDAEPGEYFEFHGDFLSMSFEGPLYSVMNNYNDFLPDYDDKLQAEFLKICEKFNKYFEMGNGWNLSLYEC